MILRSRNVVTPSGTRAATIHIESGRIARVGEHGEKADVDYGELVILPGLVDSHVHVNEPGRTDWEGFETATRAAAAGGVTTVVDMPLNSIPPTTSVEALMIKAAAMEGKCWIDVGLWGGAVPGNARELRSMLDHGALGFKCFLVDSGAPEFDRLDDDGLRDALNALAGTDAPLLVHAELPEKLRFIDGDPRSYRLYLASRPPQAEEAAIEMLSAECAASGARAHVVHLSSAGGLEILRRARDANVPLTAETTPHYLHFEAESIPDGAPAFKCAPPIREHANREALWRGVHEGLLNAIVSDHSPCPPELKRLDKGDVAHAWGGIASLQFGLSVIWSERRLTLEKTAELMCSGPAQVAGLQDRKGSIAPAHDADFVVFDPQGRFAVTPEMIQHRHKVTPYAGEELLGMVKATWLRGRKVWEDGKPIGNPAGQWIRL